MIDLNNKNLNNTTQSRLRIIVLAAFTLFAFTACNEIEVQDGKVPSQYVQYVSPYLGTYSGMMEGKLTQITLSMNGDKPVMSVSNAYGDDILVSNCESKIGDLTTVKANEVSKKKYELDYVAFAFNPVNCLMVEGRSVILRFKKTNEFSISILNRDERVTRCLPPTPNLPGTPPTDPSCDQFGEVTYFRGSFKR